MARQLIVDLYGCEIALLNDANRLKEIAERVVESIGAKIVEEKIHLFDPIGITYFAIISTSHFSIHTWPEHAYAAIDLFSCSDYDANRVSSLLQEYFGAEEVKSRSIERRISAE